MTHYNNDAVVCAVYHAYVHEGGSLMACANAADIAPPTAGTIVKRYHMVRAVAPARSRCWSGPNGMNDGRAPAPGKVAVNARARHPQGKRRRRRASWR